MIKAVINLLKPAPHLPSITDPHLIEERYRYWRIRTFYSMYIGYLFYYFTRKSFTFITPFLITDLEITKGEIGLLASIMSLVYGVSKFTSGILCDRSNPRYFMGLGLILTGICNILFGLFSSVLMFAIFWGLNGWFQGWGWPACTKQLTHWYGRTERGRWWSMCTTSQNLGAFLVAYLAAYCAKWYGWRFGMFAPGILCVITGAWLLNRLRDVPQSLGLPSIEQFKEEPMVDKHSQVHLLSIRQILFEQILTNKYVWILALSYFFVYIVRVAVNDWGPIYLVEIKGYSPVEAAMGVSSFEAGGFFGMLMAGWTSDRWFEGKRVPVMILGALCLGVAVYSLWYVASQQLLLTSLLIGVIGFLVFGPQMLIGLAAAEFVTKKAASTSNGFVSCFASLGAIIAGYPLGKIAEVFGWHAFIVTLVICAALLALVLIPIWSVKSAVEEGKKEAPLGTTQEVPSFAPRVAQ